ncbi:MAG: ArsR/SmtB family transcription factor [Actinomycetota bacterium]
MTTRTIPTASLAATSVEPVSDGCCPPAADAGLSLAASERLARVFKAVGDPTRVRLLSLIAAGERGEACICDLTEPVGLSQGTVSHHMRVLADAGLVEREQRGKWAYYSVVRTALDDAATAVRSL